MTNSSAFIYVFLALFVGVGLGFLIGRGRKATDGSESVELANVQTKLTDLQGKLSESRNELDRERARNQDENLLAQQVKEMQDRLKELRDQAKSTNEERIRAETQIKEQVSAMNSLNTDLVNQTRALSSALNNAKERGNFGEVQLENLLKASGLREGVDYLSQRASSDTTRPDIKLFLPDDNVLFIDSKLPFDNFLAAHNTEDENLQREFMKKHVADVRDHVKKLASKEYQNTGDSPNYVVMFMPFDSLLIEALKTDSKLLGDANQAGVSLASPLTLWPLLQNIKYVIGLQRVASEIHEVKNLAAQFLKNLSNVQSGVEKVGSNIKTLINTYNALVPATETTVRRTAKKIAEFEVEGSALDRIEPITKEVREFKQIPAAELDSAEYDEDDISEAEIVDEQ